MAEEERGIPAEQEPQAIAIPPAWSNDPEAVPEVYVNRFFINEGASDVSIGLGSEYREAGRPAQRLCRVRLMMTHDQFFQFAEEVRKEAAFLMRLYQGAPPPSLRGVNREAYNEAVAEIYSDDWEQDDDSDEKQF